MHVRKANDELWKLASAPATLGTFVIASALLDGLDKDNEDVDDGQRLNGTARDKISETRSWFEVLCGIGEDGIWPEETLRDFIRQDLAGIGDQIDNEEDSASSHFKRWPAVESAG
jgi:hypothetical protein